MKRSRSRTLAAVGAALSTALLTVTAGAAAGLTVPRTDEAGPVLTDFRISSFNVLGSTHTAGRGKHSRMLSGIYRIGLAAKLLNRREIDVVGFQELQMDQFYEFMRVAGDQFGVYPGDVDGNRRTVQNSMAWRLDEWIFVEGHTVPIPYFNGNEWEMPVVKLQNLESGQQAWFANFHNPATNRRHPGQDEWRAEAARREIALANTLYYETGLPVFFTGDMNDREEYFCPMVSGAPMKAANGGRYIAKYDECVPPPKPFGVDWIFGGKKRGKFTNYTRLDGRLVKKITDHRVVLADVLIKVKPS